jgi:hypothetical protein
MAFIPLKDFLSIWHFKLIGLIGPRAMSERVKRDLSNDTIFSQTNLTGQSLWIEEGFHPKPQEVNIFKIVCFTQVNVRKLILVMAHFPLGVLEISWPHPTRSLIGLKSWTLTYSVVTIPVQDVQCEPVRGDSGDRKRGRPAFFFTWGNPWFWAYLSGPGCWDLQ